MKKILLILMVLVVPFVMISCDDDEILLPAEDFFVAFEGVSANISKNSPTPLNIPVYVAAEAGDQVTVTIGYKEESDEGVVAIEDVDFEFEHGPVLTYPIGAGHDTLRIQPIPGGTAGNLILELYLESNSAGYNMGFFYGEEADSTSHNRFVVTFLE